MTLHKSFRRNKEAGSSMHFHCMPLRQPGSLPSKEAIQQGSFRDCCDVTLKRGQNFKISITELWNPTLLMSGVQSECETYMYMYMILLHMYIICIITRDMHTYMRMSLL